MFETINNNILTILGIETMPAELQQEATERLGGIVYQKAILRALDIMTDEEDGEFEKLLEKDPDPEAIFTFLSMKIPTIAAIVTEEAEKVRAANN
jgi:hypothetical protein